jgi:hypothetical protein
MNKKAMIKACYRLWQEAIVGIANEKDFFDGSPAYSGHHTFFKRGELKTAFNIANGLCLSAKNHLIAEDQPARFKQMLVDYKGQKWYDQREQHLRNIVNQDTFINQTFIENEYKKLKNLTLRLGKLY